MDFPTYLENIFFRPREALSCFNFPSRISSQPAINWISFGVSFSPRKKIIPRDFLFRRIGYAIAVLDWQICFVVHEEECLFFGFGVFDEWGFGC